MVDLALTQFSEVRGFIEQAVADIPPARMCEQFPGVVNHPAWTLGHLCCAAGMGVQLLGGSTDEVSPAMMQRFGPGSTPTTRASDYPSKDELLARLRAVHAQLEKAVRAKHATEFSKPSPEHLRSLAPTIGGLIFFLITAHEPYHLGQVNVWKRAAGLQSKG